MMNSGKQVEIKSTNTPGLICFLSREDGGDAASVSPFSKTLGNTPESSSLYLLAACLTFTLHY